MIWLCLTVLIFTLLSFYFVFGEYRKGRFPKKAFAFVAFVAFLDVGIFLLSVILILQLLL